MYQVKNKAEGEKTTLALLRAAGAVLVESGPFVGRADRHVYRRPDGRLFLAYVPNAEAPRGERMMAAAGLVMAGEVEEAPEAPAAGSTAGAEAEKSQ